MSDQQMDREFLSRRDALDRAIMFLNGRRLEIAGEDAVLPTHEEVLDVAEQFHGFLHPKPAQAA